MGNVSKNQTIAATVACVLIVFALGYMWIPRPGPDLDAALRSAISRGDLAEVENLLKEGASPDLSAKNPNMPALEHALVSAQGNKEEIVALLLKYGADPNITCGGTPLIVKMAECGELSPKIVELFVEAGVDLSKSDRRGMTALHRTMLAGGGNAGLVAALLKGGADPNARDCSCNIPIQYGTRHEDMAALLVEAGSEVVAMHGLDITPLHFLISTRKPKVALALVKRGVDVNEEEKDGRTALFYAAYYGSLELVRAMVDKGADVNHVSNAGYTPLHSAAAGFQKEIAAFLIEQGAKLDARNQKGLTPLERARESKASGRGRRSVQHKKATIAYLEAQVGQ
jgi:ankyrin